MGAYDCDCINNLEYDRRERKAQLSKEDTTSDLISRQAAIDAVDVLCQEHRYRIPGKRETYSKYNEAWQDALDRAEGLIFNLPPVQPERAEGEWVLKDYLWECNKCGCRINVKNPLSYENEWSYFFCPHCGTKMPIAVQRF